ncbi:hypothetical protein LCGC14_2952410, partial [marine sediment metagenome]
IRFRVNDLSSQGFIWENSSESRLMSLRGSDGFLSVAGALTASGVITGPVGAVGAPAYTFTGFTNSGMWYDTAGTDTLAFSFGGALAFTANTTLMLVASGKLHIDGSGTSTVAAGQTGLAEASGTLNVSAPHDVHIFLDNDNNASGDFSIYANLTTASGTPLFKVTEQGGPIVFVNELTNSKMTIGMSIKTTALTEVIALKHSSLSHVFTDNHEADTFFSISAIATTGGAIVEGISEKTTDGVALILSGVVDADSSSTGKTVTSHGIVEVWGSHELSGGYDGPPTNTNLFVVGVRFSASLGVRMIVDKEGDIYYFGGLVAFDKYDDALMIRAHSLALSQRGGGKGLVRSHYDRFVKYYERELVALGLLGAPVKEG